jgi:D-alanyl-D-alanine dipeptidase
VIKNHGFYNLAFREVPRMNGRTIRARFFQIGLFAVASLIPSPHSSAGELPAGFVHLAAVAPTIREDIRYAGSQNFVGSPLAGYSAPVCILRKEAAEALARVQKDLEPDGLTLVVFDCYRPARAVTDMLAWARARNAPQRGPQYPRIDRRNLVSLGYIAVRSQHSTGTAVDLALARIGQTIRPGGVGASCIDPVEKRGDQGTLDFGTAFDCFDDRSWTRSGAIPRESAANRLRLVRVMIAHGFANYYREWWHFGFSSAGRAAVHDFPVSAPGDPP